MMKLIELDEKTETKIAVFLLRNAKDVKSLREKILKEEVDCCAVKPSLILDRFQLIVAANKAALHKKSGKLATKCLNTELLFNLSASKNITQSLGQFGVSDKDENVVIIIFEEKGDENKFERMRKHFVGDIVEDADKIGQFADVRVIQKAYNITEKELEVSELIDSVISRIATKEFGSY